MNKMKPKLHYERRKTMYVAKPTPQQLEWQDMELGVLIHYLWCSFPPKAFCKDPRMAELIPAETFDPKKLDPEQWVISAKEMGAKYAVFVANHCEGFSWWPTKENNFNISSTKYKNGKGDVVREFIDACIKHDIKPGLYYSVVANAFYDIDDGKLKEYSKEKLDSYFRHVEAQVTELWSEYGDLFEIWFDGGVVPVEEGGADLTPILRKYQPNAICFQGPKDFSHNVRWVGNERGLAPENCWATTNAGDAAYGGTYEVEEAGVGDPNGKYYWPAETDMPNRGPGKVGSGWIWNENEQYTARSPEYLLDCYIRSVGRNSNLLMGMAISYDGEFEDVEQFRAFGKLIKDTFGTPVAIKVAPKVRDNEVKLYIPENIGFDYLVIRENITEGQLIRAFDVIIDGETVYSSNCIGHKRIIPLKGTRAKELTFKVTESAGEWSLRDIAVY